MNRADLKVIWSMVRGAGSSGSHAERLQNLYRGQAEYYDRFRERLLRGRRELVSLLPIGEGARLVELGGGTGANLEYFGERLRAFASVTLVDLCPALLDIARERCVKQGWSHVRVVEADATRWRPDDQLPVDAVFFSYSLTMIPDWFRAIDNALAMLKPGGLLGVVDFYLSRKHRTAGRRHHSALQRAFWRVWFGYDDVFLNPDHIPYLEYRTNPLHLSEHAGSVPYLPFMKAPYYIYVGQTAGSPSTGH
jgi:S-adenosylmethionine-diacylgycerolhomoserine-N-methlytransferase